MNKPDNPYHPETVRHKIISGDGTWDDMSAAEIAKKLNCSRSAVYYALDDIKFRLNYTVKIRYDRKSSRNTANGNIYRPGTISERLYNGDWSGKTTSDIACELGTKASNIRNCIWKIRRDTGKFVEFLDGRKVRWKRGKDET